MVIWVNDEMLWVFVNNYTTTTEVASRLCIYALYDRIRISSISEQGRLQIMTVKWRMSVLVT